MVDNSVVRLRDGTFEFRLAGLEIRLPELDARAIFRKGMSLCGYSPSVQIGLQVGDGEPKVMGQLELTDTLERLRASGMSANATTKYRPVLLGPWGDPAPAEAPTTGTPKRRFVKETANPPAVKTPAKKVEPRRAPEPKPGGSWVIDEVLFADPCEQLSYEIRHAYLMTVPVGQREQWPLPEHCDLLDPFMEDIADQGGQVSRQQIVAALVDVLSGRMNDVNSRRPRPLREGGGHDARPIITRGDGAVAWRANVSSGTPAARRIMWWRRPDGGIEFARFAVHDDTEMPER